VALCPGDLHHKISCTSCGWRKKEILNPSLICPGTILAQVLKAKPFFDQTKLEEFQELTKTKVKSIRAVEREARKFLGYVPYICVSSVEKGTLLVTREGSYFWPYSQSANSIHRGCRDSMVGAMLSAAE